MSSPTSPSRNVAWHVAGALLGGPGGVARAGEVPAWARPRTAGADGTSAGIVFALADIDLLTPGRLAAGLRVAGTGSIGSDGTVTAVRGVDAKLAAARLAHADVMFAPDFPSGTGPVTTVTPTSVATTPIDASATGSTPRATRTPAAVPPREPGHLALVQIDDARQALSWLCGRTDNPVACAVAHAAANASIRLARPYQFAPARPAADEGRPGGGVVGWSIRPATPDPVEPACVRAHQLENRSGTPASRLPRPAAPPRDAPFWGCDV